MPTYDQTPNPVGDFQSALAAGVALGDAHSIPDTPIPGGIYTVVPKDYRIESLETYLPRPLRVRQKVELHDTESFIGYVIEFEKGGASRLFFDCEQETFVAILDYHDVAAANWCGHVATFKPRRSVEFQTWLGKNKNQMGQVDFARFLEDNLPDVVEPEGATLLEIALTLEAKKEVSFASGVRLQTGQIQFTYDEEIRGTAKKGMIEIPDSFVLGIPIHENGPAYKIPVRLRWRLHEGKVVFWYEIARPHRFVSDALKEIRERVEGQTDLAVFSGATK